MKKSIFARIADFINGKQQEPTDSGKQQESADAGKQQEPTDNGKQQEPADTGKQQEPADSGKQPDNCIDRNSKLIDTIVAALRSNFSGSTMSMNEYSLTVWIEDNLFYNSLMVNDFERNLKIAISNELGLNFGAIEIKMSDHDDNATEVMDHCFIKVKKIGAVQAVHKAVIYSVPGHGSLCGECVKIDSEEIVNLPGQRYNIGVGRQTVTSDNFPRVNHIAIDDNPESKEHEKNKYVSRAHAHISFSDKYGFMLYVEQGGTRMNGLRTHVIRGERDIEVDDAYAPVPLQDGDYIVLSRNVHLLFKKA